MPTWLRSARLFSGALLVLGVALLVTLVALLASGLKCDDSCADPGFADEWNDDPDSWQWNAQLYVALAGLVPAGAVLAGVIKRDPRVTRWAFAGALAAYGVWGIGFFGLVGWFVIVTLASTPLLWPLLRGRRE
jgi:hypothetical protein